MLDKIYNYVSDNDFRLIIFEDKINVVNYKILLSLEDDYIYFKSINKKISIYGNNLEVRKILKDEMLIVGNLSKIEVLNEK